MYAYSGWFESEGLGNKNGHRKTTRVIKDRGEKFNIGTDVGWRKRKK